MLYVVFSTGDVLAHSFKPLDRNGGFKTGSANIFVVVVAVVVVPSSTCVRRAIVLGCNLSVFG